MSYRAPPAVLPSLRDVDAEPTGIALIVVGPRGENQIVVAPGANGTLVLEPGDTVTVKFYDATNADVIGSTKAA